MMKYRKIVACVADVSFPYFRRGIEQASEQTSTPGVSKNGKKREEVSKKEGEVGGSGKNWNHCGRQFFPYRCAPV